MNAVARKNAMQMALHDELFYQMAMEEGITLDDNDQKHMDNKLEMCIRDSFPASMVYTGM